MPHKGTLWEHLNESYAAKQIAVYVTSVSRPLYLSPGVSHLEDVLERALIAFEQQHPDQLTIENDTNIDLLFTWSDTDEGHDYWSNINDCHP